MSTTRMISAWMYAVKVNLPAKLCKCGLMILGCHITWICSNWWWPWWEEVRALFIAAVVAKDNILIAWINNVIKTRCSKRYTPEYCQVLPEEERDNPWLWSFEEGRVYETACTATTAILAEIQHREHRGKPKM